MNPLYGPFTAIERDTLSSTGKTLAPLRVPGCRDLATRLDCIAQTRRPTATQIAAAITLAITAQRVLTLDASPDRWLDEVATFSPEEQSDIISELIAQRRAQADQVAACLGILRAVTPARTALT